MKKNGFFTFIFSFIPGAGQMYQEYMKRGLSIMILSGIFLALAAMIGSPIFIIPILVICAYSFFDTYHIRNMTEEKIKEFKDEYIWNENTLGLSIDKSKLNNNRKIIGYILIIVGIYVLFDSVFLRMAWQLEIEWLSILCAMLSRYTPTVAASLVAVFAGFKLITPKDKED